jgi:hypothetical protein
MAPKAGTAARAAPQSQTNPTPTKALYPMAAKWKYDLFLWIMGILIDLFFREVHPRGAWKVPKSGPVMFVAAPHANQVSIPCFLISMSEPAVDRIPCSSWMLLSYNALCVMKLAVESPCSSHRNLFMASLGGVLDRVALFPLVERRMPRSLRQASYIFLIL